MTGKMQCTIDSCERPVKAKGMCAMHHQRWFRHGDPLWKKPPRATCSVKGCENLKHTTHSYCQKHTYAFLRYGNPLLGRILNKNCSVPGCQRPHRAKGYCGNHYNLLAYHSKKKTTV